VFAMSKHKMNASIPTMFRSYEAMANPGPDCTIWEALYATMAHPDLFKGIDIGDYPMQQSFVGGDLGCSNPIGHVLAEVKRMYPNRHVSCILSIGAGHARTIHIPDPSPPQRMLGTEAVTAMKDMATDSERVAEEMSIRFRDTAGVYFRFNVDQGMQNMEARHWDRLDEVVAHTQAYLQKTETNQRMSKLVQVIKERRTAVSTRHIGKSSLSDSHLPTIQTCESRF
jgi:hypothetical protein